MVSTFFKMGSIYINDLLVFSARLLFITKYVYIRFQEMCMFSYIFTKQVCKILYCAYILPCLFKTTAGTFVWSWGCPSTCAPSSSQPSTSLSTTSLPVQNSLAATRSVELAIQKKLDTLPLDVGHATGESEGPTHQTDFDGRGNRPDIH